MNWLLRGIIFVNSGKILFRFYNRGRGIEDKLKLIKFIVKEKVLGLGNIID